MENKDFDKLLNKLLESGGEIVCYGDNISNYEFVSNFDIKLLQHTQLCAQLANLDYIIKDDAYDINNNPISNNKALFAKKEQHDPFAIDKYWGFNTAFVIFTENYLVEKEICDTNFFRTNWTVGAYIGCEKEYFNIEFSDEEKADFLQKLSVFAKEHIDMWGYK